MRLGGLTDGPPHVHTASRLVSLWLDVGEPQEWTAPDGSFIWRYATLDFDYLVAYLLSVTSPESGSSDMLAVFVRHGRHPENGWDLDVEWRQQPALPGDGRGPRLHDAHRWFVDWAFDRV